MTQNDDTTTELAAGRSFPKLPLAGVGVLAGSLVLAGAGVFLSGPGVASAASAQRLATPVAAAPHVAAAAKKATTKAAVKKAAAKRAAAVPADADQAARDAFFAAGYTYDDAVALAKLWHSDDPFSVKATAGKELEAGKTLPVKPGSTPASTEEVAANKESAAVDAFFAHGYTYDDAVTLANLWHSATPYDAKIAGGQKLLDGQTLPVKP